jgi:NADH-quinone oxidoreductase subunit N
LLSIGIGSIGALYQVKIKRLLAYSTIANMGYILLGLCTMSFIGVFASLYYFFIYILILIQIFSILINFRYNGSFLKFKTLIEFASISHANFILSFFLIFALFSLAGLPPLVGFFGKLFLFLSLIIKGYYYIALYVVLFSVVTCIYYIRLIRFL